MHFQTELENRRAAGEKIVFTNGCFDILHVGHVELLSRAKSLGDFLVVGLNSDASVRRLKGDSRPIHPQNARKTVLEALRCVDAVVVFEDDTPIQTLEWVRPDIHVKGGDYTPEALPEAATVKKYGGKIEILPLVQGFSTTKALERSAIRNPQSAIVMVPARFGSTRFPGKPLAQLGGQTVISRVVRQILGAKNIEKPVVVCTDHDDIAREIESQFSPDLAVVARTSPDCHTGTDRLAQATRERFGDAIEERKIIVNVQGDEPFINAEHIEKLVQRMARDEDLRMATLATPILDAAQHGDPNVVQAVVSQNGKALYFSRADVPFDREKSGATKLRHLGIYAYEANWLLEMASLPPSKLEEIEKLEQLRALENGVEIGIEIVENVVSIAIDTPEDLEKARAFVGTHGNASSSPSS